jgi:hypothetical protein
LPAALSRIHALAAAHRVQLTRKARFEMAELGLHLSDAVELLSSLHAWQSRGRAWSSVTGEWLLIFEISAAGVVLYLKVILRAHCVVVSLHEDEHPEDDGPRVA